MLDSNPLNKILKFDIDSVSCKYINKCLFRILSLICSSIICIKLAGFCLTICYYFIIILIIFYKFFFQITNFNTSIQCLIIIILYKYIVRKINDNVYIYMYQQYKLLTSARHIILLTKHINFLVGASNLEAKSRPLQGIKHAFFWLSLFQVILYACNQELFLAPPTSLDIWLSHCIRED